MEGLHNSQRVDEGLQAYRGVPEESRQEEVVHRTGCNQRKIVSEHKIIQKIVSKLHP